MLSIASSCRLSGRLRMLTGDAPNACSAIRGDASASSRAAVSGALSQLGICHLRVSPDEIKSRLDRLAHCIGPRRHCPCAPAEIAQAAKGAQSSVGARVIASFSEIHAWSPHPSRVSSSATAIGSDGSALAEMILTINAP